MIPRRTSPALPDRLKLGEAYMNGTFVVEQGSIADLLKLVMGSGYGHALRWTRPRRALRAWRAQATQRQARATQRRASIYDLDQRLYALFLDSDRQYSCGYFDAPAPTLDDAQRAKKRHLAAKLWIPPGARVLDIGCGWGGRALTVLPAVERAGLLVTDIEILRLHYAATLRAWRERFLAHCETVRSSMTCVSCACGSSTSRRPRWPSPGRT